MNWDYRIIQLWFCWEIMAGIWENMIFIGKHNLMNTSTHVPLIVRVPGMKKGKTKSMVEFVDLYPTLCELCKLPVPAEQLSGQSFAGVFKNLKAKTKGEVYIQWEGGDNAVDRRYSYAEWMKGDVKKASMLFDPSD